jgi:hypothetical protein
MTDDYDDWAAKAREICATQGVALPDEATLLNMYDDGLEPREVAYAKLRDRYGRAAARRQQAGTVSDFLAHHRPNDA